MVAALRGYKLICTAPDKIPQEKITLLRAFGAEVITCPTNVPADDPRSYYKVAERIRDERGAYLPYQYYNQANPRGALRSPPGPRSGARPTGRVTHWVAGVGTGGTISGVAKLPEGAEPGDPRRRRRHRRQRLRVLLTSTASSRRPTRSTST